jgi:hypothetical protein
VEQFKWASRALDSSLGLMSSLLLSEDAGLTLVDLVYLKVGNTVDKFLGRHVVGCLMVEVTQLLVPEVSSVFFRSCYCKPLS